MYSKVILPEVISGKYGKPDTQIDHCYYTETGVTEVTGIKWQVVRLWLDQFSETRTLCFYDRDFGWLFPVLFIDDLIARGKLSLRKPEVPEKIE